jgi:hypothetical protein
MSEPNGVLDEEQTAIWRAMTPEQRLRAGLKINHIYWTRMQAKIRAVHPEWTRAELNQEIMRCDQDDDEFRAAVEEYLRSR